MTVATGQCKGMTNQGLSKCAQASDRLVDPDGGKETAFLNGYY